MYFYYTHFELSFIVQSALRILFTRIVFVPKLSPQGSTRSQNFAFDRVAKYTFICKYKSE